jgi:hypothetical protein
VGLVVRVGLVVKVASRAARALAAPVVLVRRGPVACGPAVVRGRVPRALAAPVVLVPRVRVLPVRVARRAAARGPVPVLGLGLAIIRSAQTRPAWARRLVVTAPSVLTVTTARVTTGPVATAPSASRAIEATAARVRVSPAQPVPVAAVLAAVDRVAPARPVSLVR